MGLIKIGERKEKQEKLNEPGDNVDPLYVFSGSINTNKYEDITSNKNWIDIGPKAHDYIKCRGQVKEWTAYWGFSALTETEKEVASKHFATSKSNRDEVHTEEEQENNWDLFQNNMQKTRTQRWSAAKGYVSFHLSTSDSIDIAKSTKDLSEDYTVYGIESYEADGVSALFDWVEGTAAYSGDTEGFQAKSYYSQTLEDGIMDILRNGNY